MKVTAINNQNRNLQKKIFIAFIGLMPLVTPLSACKKQNITNPVSQICNIKENKIFTNNNYEDLFAFEEAKEDCVKIEKKQKDLTKFEKFIAILSGSVIASLLTLLKSKLLKIANDTNKEIKNDESN